MPESTLKYYPVLARLLLLLEGKPLVTYRAAIVTRHGQFVNDYRMVHRFVTEYKGGEFSGGREYHDLVRSQGLQYLAKKCRKAKRFEGKSLEPVVETEIDLRGVHPTLATAS